MDVLELEKIAKKIRYESIKQIYLAGSGHMGSSLSSADILTALYFGDILKHNPLDQNWNGRDYFILSNGHACPAWYAVLAYRGFFPIPELENFRDYGHFLQGHPDKSKFEYTETTTGSLGQGITVGLGIAWGLKRTGRKNLVYVLESDGEQDEGAVWEVNRIAAHQKLDNLKVIIDRNGMQIDAGTEEVSALEPLDEKYQSFGWNAMTINGHDIKEIIRAVGEIKQVKDRPSVIIAKTVRGQGVSYMENSLKYHAKSLTREEFEIAKKELNG